MRMLWKRGDGARVLDVSELKISVFEDDINYVLLKPSEPLSLEVGAEVTVKVTGIERVVTER